MTKLFLDLETYSPVPIKNGTWAYSEKAEIILFAWAIDDGSATTWDCTAGPMPKALADALRDPAVQLLAHNVPFDRTLMLNAGGPIERAAAQDTGRWFCTMVQAMTHGLPGGLMDLCDILKVPTDKAKDRDGKRLIHLLT